MNKRYFVVICAVFVGLLLWILYWKVIDTKHVPTSLAPETKTTKADEPSSIENDSNPPPLKNSQPSSEAEPTPAILIETFSVNGGAGKVTYEAKINGAKGGGICAAVFENSSGEKVMLNSPSTTAGCSGATSNASLVSGSTWTGTLIYKQGQAEYTSRKMFNL